MPPCLRKKRFPATAHSGFEKAPSVTGKDFSEKDFASQQFPGFDIKYSASQEKSLHKLISTIALFTFAGALFAQSPFAGRGNSIPQNKIYYPRAAQGCHPW
jgi:hypothetical protein